MAWLNNIHDKRRHHKNKVLFITEGNILNSGRDKPPSMHWRHTSYAIVTHEKVTAFYLLQTKAHLRARDAGWSLSQPLFPCYPLINHIMHCNLQLYNCSSLSIFSRGDRPRVGVGSTRCPGKMHLSHVCKINPGLHS